MTLITKGEYSSGSDSNNEDIDSHNYFDKVLVNDQAEDLPTVLDNIQASIACGEERKMIEEKEINMETNGKKRRPTVGISNELYPSGNTNKTGKLEPEDYCAAASDIRRITITSKEPFSRTLKDIVNPMRNLEIKKDENEINVESAPHYNNPDEEHRVSSSEIQLAEEIMESIVNENQVNLKENKDNTNECTSKIILTVPNLSKIDNEKHCFKDLDDLIKPPSFKLSSTDELAIIHSIREDFASSSVSLKDQLPPSFDAAAKFKEIISSPTNESQLSEIRQCIDNVHMKVLIYKNGSGQTKLHEAAASENGLNFCIAIVERLQKADLLKEINARDNNSGTALYYATINDPLIVYYLLSVGADPNVLANHNGSYNILGPLHLAARYGHIYMHSLQVLLDSPDIDVNKKNNNGLAALHIAMERHGKKTTIHDKEIQIDSSGAILCLLWKGADAALGVSTNGRNLIHMLVEAREVLLLSKVLQFLKERYGDEATAEFVNKGLYDENTALHLAAGLKKTQDPNDFVVRKSLIGMLLSYGAKKDAMNREKKKPMRCIDVHDSAEKKELTNLLETRR